MLAVGVDKILGTHDVSMGEGGYDVGILETTVENGDGDAFAHESDVMQTVSSQHLNLLLAIAIGGGLQTVPGVETVVGTGLDEAVDAVGGYPYQLRLPDTLEGVETTEEGGIVGTDKYGVVPSAGSDDGPFRGTAFALTTDRIRSMLECTDILLADRQVGGIDGQSLFTTALDGFMRQPTTWVINRVGGALLVFQGIAPNVEFAPRVLDLGATACQYRQWADEQ